MPAGNMIPSPASYRSHHAVDTQDIYSGAFDPNHNPIFPAKIYDKCGSSMNPRSILLQRYGPQMFGVATITTITAVVYIVPCWD